MPYPSAFFFALMTHKSVTYAMFPNKPGVPLTEKIKYTCTFFWRRDLPTFFFLAHEYFTRFVCVVCFPRPSFKFHSQIFIRRVISEFIAPTTSLPFKFTHYLPPHTHTDTSSALVMSPCHTQTCPVPSDVLVS